MVNVGMSHHMDNVEEIMIVKIQIGVVMLGNVKIHVGMLNVHHIIDAHLENVSSDFILYLLYHIAYTIKFISYSI